MKVSIKVKLLGGFFTAVALMAVMIVVVYFNLRAIDQASDHLIEEAFSVENYTMELMTVARNEQQLLTDFSLTGNQRVRDEIKVAQQEFDAKVSGLRLLLEGERLTQLEEIATAENSFVTVGLEMADLYRAGNRDAGQAKMDEFDAAANAFIGQLEELESLAHASVDEAEAAMHQAQANAIWLSLGISLVGAIIMVVAGLYLSLRISRSVREAAQAAAGIAEGDLEQRIEINSNDELGDMATAFTRMINYLEEMAAAADQMTQGNLAVEITPQSERDALGNAFAQMLTSLRDLIGQVQGDAESVASASRQISAASEQAGGATQQIAATIQQVAQGAAQQSEGVTDATSKVEQIARASDGVAAGAQEQAQAVQKTSNLIGDMAGVVDQMEQMAHSVNEASTKVTQAARDGVTTVEQTGRGMETIQTHTKETAEKVREMDVRSSEIERIVEMIDEIADKTDMLALNAAVEAARAGEHGRGFAVVADQVRKLSEDSKAATREISELIRRVQETVHEAIAAMEATSTEVTSGTQLAQGTAQSLEEILQAAEDTAGQVELITSAVANVKQQSEGVIEAIESVSAVVEENTASAEEMAAGSQEVTEAMEDVASVAEENSAAAEEVSAASEEMAAQVQQVEASTQSLSEMAQALKILVKQFRLSARTTIEDEQEVLETFRQAHFKWVERVEDMLAGGEVFEAHPHTECALGRWYQKRGHLDWGHLPEFEAIDVPHQELHELLADIVTAHTRGNRKRAEALLAQLEQVSQRVVQALDALEQRIVREVSRQEVPARAARTTFRAGNGQRDEKEAVPLSKVNV